MSKKIGVFIGFTTAILAVILAVTPLSNLAVAPIGIAFLSALGLLFISKKQQTKTKTVQYIFLLASIALSLTIYKSIFSITEVGDTQQLNQRDEENLEDSKEILEDIEIDEDF